MLSDGCAGGVTARNTEVFHLRRFVPDRRVSAEGGNRTLTEIALLRIFSSRLSIIEIDVFPFSSSHSEIWPVLENYEECGPDRDSLGTVIGQHKATRQDLSRHSAPSRTLLLRLVLMSTGAASRDHSWFVQACSPPESERKACARTTSRRSTHLAWEIHQSALV